MAPRGSASALRLVINYLSFIVSGYALAPSALRGRGCDVVFVYAMSPLLQALPAIRLARRRRVPLVIWVQDLWPESLPASGMVTNRWVFGAVEAVARYIYRRADSILIQSEAFRGPVARLADDPGKIRYYPNTAEPVPDGLPPGGAGGAAAEIAAGFSVVFAGNIGAAQSMETVLDAAERLATHHGIRFFIVGGGSREAWVAQEIGRRRLGNVLLTGRLPSTAMPEIFAAAAGLLLTLGSAPALALTVPSKLQAYLAAGRPVIASVNGEGARVVEEAGAGLTCPAEDGEALAAAVLRLYRMTPEERCRMGERGRRYFEAHFDPERRVRELIDHLARITTRGRGDAE
jgi:glycosyltransferase involved in cell wall biosynthesis